MMKMMKCLFLLPLWLVLFFGNAKAEDTDLFMINPAASSQRPNILIIFDNTSNWRNYFANEQSALVTLLNSSTINENFNLGFMFFDNPNNKNGLGSAESGVVVAAIRRMTETNKGYYRDLFAGLVRNDDQGSSSPTYAGAMMEAWRYFTGQNATDGGMNDTQRDYAGNTASSKAYFNNVHALSGNALLNSTSRAYQSPVADICQKNFIIFISNGTPSSSEANAPYDLATQAGTTIAPVALSNSFFQSNYADEWAGFMASHQLSNKPHVYTYTVSVDASNWPSHPQDAQDLLASMAKQGNGKYVAVSNNAQALIDELDKIFQEISAANSVFASVTLPVNVNATGQALNQIYMGVFRPDAGASPRWPGNLKLYKIEVKSNGTPEMVGRECTGTAPNQVCREVHDTVNGFMYPTAQSFWTTATTANVTQLVSTPPNVFQFGAYKFWNSTYYPDAQGSGAPPSGTRDGVSDLPDGEMVEKGGAAQHLRGRYSYDSVAGSARVPDRNLYTCTGTACVNQPTVPVSLSSMLFKSTNSALDATAFGLAANATISSLTRAGSTCSAVSCISRVTATTSAAHSFVAGTSITVSGASDNTFNGTVQIQTVPNSTSFTYDITESPVPSGTGSSMTATTSGSGIAITNVTASVSGMVRTVTVTAPSHGLVVGTPATVTLSGINPAADYSGSRTVSVPDANTVSFTVNLTASESPAAGTSTYASPYPTATFYTGASCSGSTAGAVNLGSGTRSAGSTTFTLGTTAASVKTPNTAYLSVKLQGGSGYDACYACDSGSTACKKNSASFAVTVSYTTTTSPAAPTFSGATLTTSSTTAAISSLTRGPSNCSTNPCRATVTVTVPTSLPFSGNSAIISGTGVFDGTYAVTGTPTGTTFTYTIDTQPVRDVSTGTMTASLATGTLTSSQLINWVRGQNVREEDNPSELAEDVRGYLHGDVLHSRPAIINYNRTGQPADRDLVVFYGANDGMLHALKGGRDDADGNELWGFVAPEHFTRFQRMYANAPLWSLTASRPYFFDGPITTMTKGTKDATTGALRIEGDSAEALVFAGMRRGGRSYYAFDVTSPSDPKYQWRIQGGVGDFVELGYTWSEAKAVKIKLGTVDTDVLIFGGGYDPLANDASPQGTATMGRGIFVVNARTGALIWRVGPTPAGSDPQPTLLKSDMTCSIPADIVTLDADGNGYVDRVYAVDTCGNVWRANIGDTDKTNWKVGKLFALGGSGANQRKFLYAPSVVRETSYDILLIGSGDREKPFDLGIENRFYALRDYQAVNDLGGVVTQDPPAVLDSPTVLDSDLCDFTSEADSVACDCEWTSRLSSSAGWSNTSTTRRGWKMSFVYDGPDADLELDDLCAGEKAVSGAVTIAGWTVFSTNVPSNSSCLAGTDAAPAQCTSNTGQARNYVISYQCARPRQDVNASGTLTIADRYTVDKAGGFPPTGTAIQTTDDNGKPVTGTICIGPNCITVGPQISTRRYRIYWQMGVDNK